MDDVDALRQRIAELEDQLRDERMRVEMLHAMIDGSKKHLRALYNAFNMNIPIDYGPGKGFKHPRLKEVKGMQSRRIRTL